MGDDLPVATRLVLRDQLRADAGMVISAAIDGLVACGAWRLERRWFRPARLVRSEDADLASLPEPLPSVDRMLARAVRETRSNDLRRIAAWVARRDASAPRTAVRRAIDESLESGLLIREPHGLSHRVVPSAVGSAAIEGLPPRTKHTSRPVLGFAFNTGAVISTAWVAGWDDGVGDFAAHGHTGHAGGHDGGGHHGGGHSGGHDGGGGGHG